MSGTVDTPTGAEEKTSQPPPEPRPIVKQKAPPAPEPARKTIEVDEEDYNDMVESHNRLFKHNTKLLREQSREAQPEIARMQDAIAAPKANLDGPKTAICGDQCVFTANECVNANSYKWALLPAGTNGLVQFPDGKKAVFSNKDEGEYMIILAVASKDGGVDVTTHTLTLHKEGPQAPVAQTEPPPATQQSVPQQQPQTQPALSKENLARYLHGLLNSVATTDRKGEAGILAGSFRTTRNLFAQGGIRQDPETLIKETVKAARLDLRDRFDKWTEFLYHVGTVIPESGGVEQYADLWENIARILETSP